MAVPVPLATSSVSGSGITNAVATSTFLGSFSQAGNLILNVDFTTNDVASGTGTAMSTLFLTLTNGGSTLFADYITGPWVFERVLAAGTTTLELLLSSQATGGFPTTGLGGADSFGQVTFFGTVPTPATLLLVVLALGAMVGARRRGGLRG
jgi:hypothetical protein